MPSWMEWVRLRFVLVAFGHDSRSPYWQRLLDLAHLEQHGRVLLQTALESATRLSQQRSHANDSRKGITGDSTFASPALIRMHCGRIP